MNFTEVYRLNESRAKSLENGNLAPNIRDTEDNKVRTRLINFYKKYSKGKPESEELDWQNSKTLTNDDFDFLDKYMSRKPNEEGEYEFFQKNSKTKHSEIYKANKKELERRVSETRAEDLFINKPEENILFHIYPEISNEDWLFVSPLTWEAAAYINSRECGLSGACWCIGWKDFEDYWNSYTDRGSKFVLAFNKKFKTLENTKIDGIPFLEVKDENGNPVTPNTLNKWGIQRGQEEDVNIKKGDLCTYQDLFTKFMIQIEDDNNIKVWIQPDIKYTLDRIQDKFGINFDVTKNDILNLDFTEFNKFTGSEYKKIIRLGYKIEDNFTKVTIPEGVTEIGYYAFSSCTSLTSIEIPDSVTEIKEAAFSGCTSLTSINIPESVTEIGEYAFSYCSLTNIDIPDSVNYIGNYAFEGCYSLTDVHLPKDIIVIGVCAFANCASLRSINIPNSVTDIGLEAFSKCETLSTIDIPSSVEEIGGYSFAGCTGLTNINLSKGVIYINDYAFAGCTKLKNITIPESVTKVGEKAFTGCSQLETISIPADLDVSEAGIPETCKIIRRGSSDDDIMAESKINMFNRVYKRFN